jgi:hypothetical protein
VNTNLIEHPLTRRVVAIIGVLGTVAAAGYGALAAGLTVPFPFLWLFFGAGLGAIVLAIRLRNTHPWWTLAIPIVGLALVFRVIEIGVRLWGWAP